VSKVLAAYGRSGDMTIPLNAKIYIADAPAWVETALRRRLDHLGLKNVTLGKQIDLQDRNAVLAYFEQELPDYVFLNAANLHTAADPFQPATWLHDNLLRVANVIEASYLYDVEKLLCLDCASPFLHPVILPWYMETLTPSHLDSSLRASQVTRNTITELCDSYRLQYGCDFVSVVTSNIYGAGRGAGVPSNHLVPALIKEVALAKELAFNRVQLLGGASQRHDLLHLNDLSAALIFTMDQVSRSGGVLVDSGQPCTLAELAELVKHAVGYQGTFEIGGDAPYAALMERPQATSLQSLGWHPSIPLAAGLSSEYRWYMRHRHQDYSGS
jgi:GDP-L-fucose synthase